MNKETVLVAIIALLVGGISGYAFSQHTDREYACPFLSDVSSDQILMGMHRMPDGSLMGNGGPGPMGHMMDMAVSSERDFIEGMIPHHQEAVLTAKEVLERGATTPEIRMLVENIIVAQEQEIAEMKQWYQSWYGEAYQDSGAYQPMMRELEGLSGEAIDRAFLTDMIMHHMGAIMMARGVEPYVEHQEIEMLAAAIIETQSEEIAAMRTMLQDL